MAKTPAAFAGPEDRSTLTGASDVDMPAMLLRMLTDLYLQRPAHTPEDEHYYTELALRLIDAADVCERAALAARLATYPSAPRAVLERLARDAIEVAAPVLIHSTCLSAAELEAIAGACGEAHAHAIAARLPAAQGAARTPAMGDAAAARALELCELFYAASAPERRLILINLDYSCFVPWQPAAALQRADVRRLESAALQHSADTLLRELERTLGVSRVQARRIVEDVSGEPMVVAARALSLPVEALQRMLLFMNPWAGESIDRIYELSALYREITVAAARRLVAIWREASKPEHGPVVHEPVAWRRAAESARRALSEVLRRPDRQRERRARNGEGC